MKKIFAAVVLSALSGASLAHQDRILPIEADGTIGLLPARYGPVRVRITRAKGNAQALEKVVISSPRFSVVLNRCVVGKLDAVTRIEASGSWYHTRGRLPPYISLTFYSGKYAPMSATNEYYSVTYSLLDGHILMGQRAWDPPLGAWRGQVIDPADKCTHWRRLGVWPNNSFKPSPLRGSA